MTRTRSLDHLRRRLTRAFGQHLEVANLSETLLTNALEDKVLLAKLMQLVSNPRLVPQTSIDPNALPYGENGLIHGVYRHAAKVKANLFGQFHLRNIDCPKFSWIGSADAPAYDPRDPEVAVVLVVTLGTLAATLNFIHRSIREEHRSVVLGAPLIGRRWKQFHLSNKDFTPYTLRWVQLRLNANADLRPDQVVHARAMPDLAVLYAAAQHPERFHAIHRQTKRFWVDGIVDEENLNRRLIVSVGEDAIVLDLVDRTQALLRGSASPAYVQAEP